MPTRFCRHIRINGERCGSPALNSGVFCYYHVAMESRHRAAQSSHSNSTLHPITLEDGSQRNPIAVAEPLQLNFPPLEDRHSIQMALSMIIPALAEGRIDPRLASLLFYGLQVASSNAKDLIPPPPPNRPVGKVRQTVLDPNSGTLIAPDEDPSEEDTQDYRPMGSVQRYLLELKNEKEESDRKAQDERNRLAAIADINPPLLPMLS